MDDTTTQTDATVPNASSDDQKSTPTSSEVSLDTVPTTDSAEMLLSLESMIKQHVSGIESGKEQLKKFREMMASVLANDSTYQEQEKAAKEAARVKTATKTQLMKQQAVAATVSKAKELSEQIKEMEDGLSDYLREYQRLSGSNEIETDDGNVREIIYIAKLIKRSSSKRK